MDRLTRYITWFMLISYLMISLYDVHFPLPVAAYNFMLLESVIDFKEWNPEKLYSFLGTLIYSILTFLLFYSSFAKKKDTNTTIISILLLLLFTADFLLFKDLGIPFLIISGSPFIFFSIFKIYLNFKK